MTIKSTFLLILCGLAIVACQESPVSVDPEPQIVHAEQLPSSQNQYYLIRTAGNAERFEDGASPILKQLLKADFEVRDAWYPIGRTPCMAATAVEALVVRLQKRDDRIAAMGFTPDPGHFIVNCGINTYAYYQFD